MREIGKNWKRREVLLRGGVKVDGENGGAKA